MEGRGSQGRATLAGGRPELSARFFDIQRGGGGGPCMIQVPRICGPAAQQLCKWHKGPGPVAAQVGWKLGCVVQFCARFTWNVGPRE